MRMLLLFEKGGVPFFLGVSGKRLVSLASQHTKFVFKPMSSFVGEVGFKGELLGKFSRRVKSFSSFTGLQSYLVGEMEKLGFVFNRVVSVEVYLDFVGVAGK